MRTSFTMHPLAVVLLAVFLSGCWSESLPSLVAKGQAALAKGEASDAVIHFKAAIQAEPGSTPTRLLLGQALLESGDFPGAIVELSRALAEKSDPAEVMPPLARAHLHSGQLRKLVDTYGKVKLLDKRAESDFKTSMSIAWGAIGNQAKSAEAMSEALDAAPDSPRARLTQARRLFLIGQRDSASAAVDKILASDPKQHEAWQLKGELLLLRQGGEQLADEAFNKALEIKKDFIPSLSSLAISRVRAGDMEGAKKRLEILRGVAPNAAETVFIDAQLAYFDKDYRKARDGVQMLMRVAPDNVNLLQLAAAVEWQGGSLTIAERMLSKALANDPTLEQVRINLAHIYTRLAQPARALASVEPLTRQAEPNPAALGAAGEAALQLGDLTAAEAFFSRAAALAPGDVKTRTSMAMTQLARGNESGGFSSLESLAMSSLDGYADAALTTERLKRGDLAAALAAADRMVQKQPGSSSAHQLRGRVLMASGDLTGARRAFEQAMAVDPGSLVSVGLLADLDLRAGRAAEAQKRFEDYLAQNPANHLAMLSLADLKSRRAAPSVEVQELIARAIKAAPDLAEPRLNLINFLASQRQVKAALTVAQEAVAVLPQDVSILDALGRMQALDGNAQQALTTFRRITIINPGVSQAHIRMAELHKAAGNKVAAVASLRQAIEVDPRSKWARTNLVMMLVDDKRGKEALELAKELQRREPESPAGYLLEGAAHRRMKNDQAAISAYSQGMKLAKDRSEVVLNLFATLLASNEWNRAEALGKDWLAANPLDGGMHYSLGEGYMSRKMHEQAERHFRKSLNQRPDFDLALNNLAYVLLQLGKPGATSLAQQAVDLAPNQPVYLDTLSQALEAEGKIGEALKAQQAAVDAAPGNPSLRFRLAGLALKAGDKSLARGELERVVAIKIRNPFRDEASKLLQTL